MSIRVDEGDVVCIRDINGDWIFARRKGSSMVAITKAEADAILRREMPVWLL